MIHSATRPCVGRFFAFSAVLALAVGCGRFDSVELQRAGVAASGDQGHGHDHGPGADHSHSHDAPPDHGDTPPEASELDPVVVTQFTERAGLFMEHPQLMPGQEQRFLVHVTVLETGEPVSGGELRIEFEAPNGPSTFVAQAPERAGVFVPVGTFETPGEFRGRIVVDSEQLQETFPLEPMIVHASRAQAAAAAEAGSGDEPADLVPFLLEQQWKVGLLTQPVERRTLTRRLQVSGEVEAPHHATAVASAPLAGRLLPPGAGGLPHMGDRVEKGQVLALVEPPLTTSDVAQLAANEASRGALLASRDALEVELMMREFDLRAKALEIEQALRQSETRLLFAEAALERIEDLRSNSLGTVAELQSAQRDVEIARRASEGALALKASFAQAETQLNELRDRSEAVRAQMQSTGPGGPDGPSSPGGPGGPPRYEVVAPISGEVVAVEHVEGEHIESQDVAYRLLDMDDVWITAHVSEFDLGAIGTDPGALLELPAYPDRTFDVVRELGGRIISVGRFVDPQTRTVPLRYVAANPEGMLRAGMFADLYLETERAVDAVALPSEAVVMDNGRPVAFVLVHGEAFQRRVLELGIRDGGLVEVLDGVAPGERVVTAGAYLVKLASAAPAAFGHGHAH